MAEVFVDLFNSNSIDFIKKYQKMAIEHIKKNKKKYSASANFENLLFDFAQVKIKFIEEVRKEYGDDVVIEFFYSEQIFIAAFFGIGCDDSIERHIENNGLFWGHYLFLLKRNEFPAFHINYYSSSSKRLNRNKITSEEKFVAHSIQEHIGILFIDLYKRFGFSGDSYNFFLLRLKKDLYLLEKESKKKHQASAKYLKEKINGKQHLLVYRGFNFGANEFVRKGLYLKNNPSAHIQETGAGLSFSLDKKIAEQFALAKWEGVWKATWEKRIHWDRILLKLANVDIQKLLSAENETRYAALGIYKIPVGKIIAFMDEEKEIVVFPENIEKFRYDIIRVVK